MKHLWILPEVPDFCDSEAVPEIYTSTPALQVEIILKETKHTDVLLDGIVCLSHLSDLYVI